MSESTSPLYVRLPQAEADKLDRAAFELRVHKRDLVAGLVAQYVDPTTAAGLDQLRTVSARRSETPTPPAPERRAAPQRIPTVVVSEASNWVAGMQAEIRDFAERSGSAAPLVRITLDDGERFFVQALRAGPGDDYVNLAAYPLKNGAPRRLIVRLAALKKIELLDKPPGKTSAGYVFQPRRTPVGFASDT